MRRSWTAVATGIIVLSALVVVAPGETQTSDPGQTGSQPHIANIEIADAIAPPCLEIDALGKSLSSPIPSQLDIEIPDVRGWNRNLLEAITFPSGLIDDKFKKNFDAFVTATYPGSKEDCRIPAEIRISGDLRDHLAWQDGVPVSSLDVKLEGENIYGVVRFKLFLPSTRGENRREILQTEFLRTQNLLSPRTFEIATLINGEEVSYLFQEKLSKELVESQMQRDSVLLESDEDLFWKSGNVEELVFARVVNSSWVDRGPMSEAIGWRGITSLIRALGTTWHPIETLASGTELPNLIAPPLLTANGASRLSDSQRFQALMLATGAWHGLRPHNRKFYFDPMTEELLPVYYDGEPNGYWGIRSDSRLDVLEILARDYDAAISESDEMALVASLEVVSSNSFRDQLSKLGAVFEDEELDDWIATTSRHLNALVLPDEPISSPEWRANAHSSISPGNFLLVFGGEPDSLIFCRDTLECSEEPLSNESFSSLLDGSLEFDGVPAKYASLSYSKYLNGEDPGSLPTSLEPVGFIGESRIYASGPITLARSGLDSVSITSKLPETRVLIRGGELIDWTVIGNWPRGTERTLGQRFDENLLTGCLTFLDTKVDNLSIDMQGGGCEDSVNMISATGVVGEVVISNASQDGLDLDFSDLDLRSVVMSDAGNDCIDMSSGRYRIREVDLSTCSDKAISVGERAYVQADNVTIEKSGLGVAVKDSSDVKINRANLLQTSTCAAIYRKKQEFGGAQLRMPRNVCSESTILIQPGSKLEYLDAPAD